MAGATADLGDQRADDDEKDQPQPVLRNHQPMPGQLPIDDPEANRHPAGSRTESTIKSGHEYHEIHHTERTFLDGSTHRACVME